MLAFFLCVCDSDDPGKIWLVLWSAVIEDRNAAIITRMTMLFLLGCFMNDVGVGIGKYILSIAT
eukprot:8283672-Ditylum_brightwellii.AAC.1